MMQKKGSEGSEHPKRSVSYHEQPGKEQKQPFKKRARFLYSDDIKKVTPFENSGVIDDGRRISSTSSLRDTTEETKVEITSIRKSSYDTIYRKDVLVASLSQLAISEGAHHEDGQKASTEDGDSIGRTYENGLTCGVSARNVVANRGQVHQPVTKLDCSAIAPNVDGRNIDANSEGDHHEGDHVVEDGGDGNGSEGAIGGEEQNIKGNEPVKFFVSTMIHDGCGASNIDEKAIEDKGDCSDNAPDVVNDRKQVHEANPAIRLEGSSNRSSTDTTIQSMNDANSEGDGHEREQHVVMEDGGDGIGSKSGTRGEKQIKQGKQQVEYVVSTMIHDGCSANNICEKASKARLYCSTNAHGVIGDEIQWRQTEQVTDQTESKEDAYSDGDGHEQEQHVPMKNGGDGSGIRNVYGGEDQRKKGKQLVKYVVSTMVHDGYIANNIAEKGHKGGITPGVVGDGEFERHADPAPFINLIVERGDDTHVPFKSPSGENDNKTFAPRGIIPSGIASSCACRLAHGGSDRQRQHDPMTIIDGRKRNRSNHELSELVQDGSSGDESRHQTRKKFKYGNDEIGESSYGIGPSDGLGYDEQLSISQHGNHTFRLFGIDIPYKEEHHFTTNTKYDGGSSSNPAPGVVANDGSSPMQRPIFGFRLFGIDIPGKQMPPAAMEIEDIGNNNPFVPGSNGGHGSDESSMQHRPKVGFRLFGFDI